MKLHRYDLARGACWYNEDGDPVIGLARLTEEKEGEGTGKGGRGEGSLTLSPPLLPLPAVVLESLSDEIVNRGGTGRQALPLFVFVDFFE